MLLQILALCDVMVLFSVVKRLYLTKFAIALTAHRAGARCAAADKADEAITNRALDIIVCHNDTSLEQILLHPLSGLQGGSDDRLGLVGEGRPPLSAICPSAPPPQIVLLRLHYLQCNLPICAI